MLYENNYRLRVFGLNYMMYMDFPVNLIRNYTNINLNHYFIILLNSIFLATNVKFAAQINEIQFSYLASIAMLVVPVHIVYEWEIILVLFVEMVTIC